MMTDEQVRFDIEYFLINRRGSTLFQKLMLTLLWKIYEEVKR